MTRFGEVADAVRVCSRREQEPHLRQDRLLLQKEPSQVTSPTM
jgi:hypothetical protein